MIDIFKNIANRCRCLKVVSWITGATGVFVVGLEIFDPNFASEMGNDYFLIPGIVLLLWSLIGWLMLELFPNVPDRISKDSSFQKRLKGRVIRSCYYLLMLFYVAVTFLVIFVSWKLGGVWISEV